MRTQLRKPTISRHPAVELFQSEVASTPLSDHTKLNIVGHLTTTTNMVSLSSESGRDGYLWFPGTPRDLGNTNITFADSNVLRHTVSFFGDTRFGTLLAIVNDSLHGVVPTQFEDSFGANSLQSLDEAKKLVLSEGTGTLTPGAPGSVDGWGSQAVLQYDGVANPTAWGMDSFRMDTFGQIMPQWFANMIGGASNNLDAQFMGAIGDVAEVFVRQEYKFNGAGVAEANAFNVQVFLSNPRQVDDFVTAAFQPTLDALFGEGVDLSNANMSQYQGGFDFMLEQRNPGDSIPTRLYFDVGNTG